MVILYRTIQCVPGISHWWGISSDQEQQCKCIKHIVILLLSLIKSSTIRYIMRVLFLYILLQETQMPPHTVWFCNCNSTNLQTSPFQILLCSPKHQCWVHFAGTGTPLLGTFASPYGCLGTSYLNYLGHLHVMWPVDDPDNEDEWCQDSHMDSTNVPSSEVPVPAKHTHTDLWNICPSWCAVSNVLNARNCKLI